MYEYLHKKISVKTNWGRVCKIIVPQPLANLPSLVTFSPNDI